MRNFKLLADELILISKQETLCFNDNNVFYNLNDYRNKFHISNNPDEFNFLFSIYLNDLEEASLIVAHSIKFPIDEVSDYIFKRYGHLNIENLHLHFMCKNC